MFTTLSLAPTTFLSFGKAIIDGLQITFIGYAGCINVGITYGIGKKSAAVPLEDYSKAIMWEAIGQGVCIMGIAASKSSVAVFLLRIVVLKWHKALLWLCIVSTTIWCIVTTTLLFLQCSPTAFIWDRSIAGGFQRYDFTPVGLAMGAWSASMDFVLAILPWHVIMGLNMKRKEKLTVACGLSLGTLYVFLLFLYVSLISLLSYSEFNMAQCGHLLHHPHLRAPSPILRRRVHLRYRPDAPVVIHRGLRHRHLRVHTHPTSTLRTHCSRLQIRARLQHSGFVPSQPPVRKWQEGRWQRWSIYGNGE